MKTGTLEKSLKSAKKVNNKGSLSKEEIDDRTELIQREDVKDSPFTIITINEESFGAMGGFRITENTGTKEEVKKDLEKITWNRIIQVMMILKTVEEENKVKTEKN